MTSDSPRDRRLAAILMLDVAGFSALMGRDDEATTRRVVAFHREVRTLVDGHGGRVVKTGGDSVFGQFDSIIEAVQCAAAIQRRQAEEPEDGRLMARIGVHVGDVIVEGEDLYGDGVNIAARLEPLADPGGIAVSEAVYLEVGNRVGLPFADDGAQRLKNIERPVRVYRVPPSAFGFSDSATNPPAIPRDLGLEDLMRGVGAPAEKVLGAVSEAVEARLRDRASRRRSPIRIDRARQVPSPAALLIRPSFLVQTALGVFLLLARTTGWTKNGVNPLIGCILLGMADGALAESVTRRRGMRALCIAVGLAGGAFFLGNEVMRVLVWLLAVVAFGTGLQRFGTRV